MQIVEVSVTGVMASLGCSRAPGSSYANLLFSVSHVRSVMA